MTIGATAETTGRALVAESLSGSTTVIASERPAPLIAGKQALVRAVVNLEPGFGARPLLGVLDLDDGQSVSALVSERTLGRSSLHDDLATNFVFDPRPNGPT